MDVHPPIHMVGIDTSPNTIQLRLSSLVSFYKSRFDFSETNLTKISESLSMVPKISEICLTKHLLGQKRNASKCVKFVENLENSSKTASCPPFFFMASGKSLDSDIFKKIVPTKTVDHPLVWWLNRWRNRWFTPFLAGRIHIHPILCGDIPERVAN